MKINNVLLLGFLMNLIWWGAIIFLVISVGSCTMKEIDENGGLKSIAERVWEGKEENA